MALVPPPAAELTIPPTDPQVVSTCSSPRPRYDEAAVPEKSASDVDERLDAPAGVRDGPYNGGAEGQYSRRPNDDGIYYPEGGFKAWMVVVGSCFGTAVTLGMMNTVGTIQAYVREHQLRSASMLLLGLSTGSMRRELRQLASPQQEVPSVESSSPLALQKLYTVVSFAWATRIVGLVVIFCCAVAVILVRSRLPPKPGQTVIPSLHILRDPAYLLVTLGTYFMEWALFVPIAYITAFALSTGAMSTAFSYQLIAIMNAGSSIGRALPGYVADKLGRFNSMIAALVVCTAMTITLWLPASILTTTPSSAPTIKALSIVFALVFGFASGSNVSLAPVCVGQLCDTNEYGRYYATCYTIVSFGTLTGIPIAGSLLQHTGGRYWGVVLWTTLCYVISLGCFIWSRSFCVGWKLGVKF
ncbi:riboflavin transporter MCH5 [Microsporum canis CBS 113480]|uniref:Riboflavin transporter MCH5 n=1 Tax=Arthroderma otae (strain ATCC MYA-4605 / CBS 113480) TaxID=554155 RepID=C5FY42_ARTOC|nr:riboflavin transporter MCH5 [Microsporum canis CBS 113480]EEQ34440.1 riboflavin transporter MCH5 [Microsporum canis CBS 113480]